MDQFDRTFIETPQKRFLIDVPQQTRDRLDTKCFRPKLERCAGEIAIASSIEDLLLVPKIGTLVAKAFVAAIDPKQDIVQGYQEVRIQVACPTAIGWDSTDDSHRYDGEMLELHAFNRGATGHRVLPSLKSIKAPKTSLLTITASLYSPPTWRARATYFKKAVIRTMYPGVNVGPITGDMTAKTGRVWFDWSHPGE